MKLGEYVRLNCDLDLEHTHTHTHTHRPLQRDNSEVKELSHHLSHFPSLLPDPASATPTILVGVAARCLLETIPRSRFSREFEGVPSCDRSSLSSAFI